MAEEHNPSRAPRFLIGVVVVALLAAGTVWFLTRDAGGPGTEVRSGAGATTTSVSAEPELPSIRFDVGDREVVPTARGRVSERERRTAREAADRVESLVGDLYVGAFLDPELWTAGTYEDVFELFAGGARTEARQRVGVLTAGESAGDRFDRIQPVAGRMTLRILLDRGGNPILVAAKVRFKARASGEEPALIRSEGSYLFRRNEGSWRIASFDVERADEKRGTA